MHSDFKLLYLLFRHKSLKLIAIVTIMLLTIPKYFQNYYLNSILAMPILWHV